MMSESQLKEIKELLNAHFSANNARLESRIDLIDYKLDSINNHLEKQNGRISKSELVITEFITKFAILENNDKDYVKHRSVTCPQINRIDAVEQDIVTKKEIKKYFVSTIGIIVTLLTILTTIINFI